MLLVALVPDLLDVLLRYDPARAGRARVEDEEVGPRLLETKPHPAGRRDLDGGDALLERLVGGAAVALERELDVLGRDRISGVKRGALAQDELVREPVGRDRPRLGAS